jgi:methyltransferase (TIGR00027 family)
MTDDAEITSVADTAFWVASLRGRNVGKSDAVIADPLSAMLAGDRGRKISRSLARESMTAWAVAIRSSAIDRLLQGALRTGCDTIINLGAGLDTRPYRLTLPPELRWIEIDLPAIIEFKQARLREHQPHCVVERVSLDLRDCAARNEILTRYGTTSRRSVLIAEGVIPYFSNQDVMLLAKDLALFPGFQAWILDFDNAGKRPPPKAWRKKLQAAPFLFQVDDWFDFFRRAGWQSQEIITSAMESERINMPIPFEFPLGLLTHALPAAVRRQALSLTGAVMLEHKAS